MNAPVVLNEARKVSVVGVGNQQRLSRLAAADSDGEEQVVIVNPAVAVTVEIREILDHFNSPLLEDAQVKVRVNALYLAAEVKSVIASDHCQRIAELQAALLGALRDAKRRAVLDAGEGQ